MSIQISATNPCHLYELALELYQRGALEAYYSGYPRWKLRPPPGFPFREMSARTLVTYGLNRLPAMLRPEMVNIFRWQDEGFDRAVSKRLTPGGWIHALPGQALETFKRARKLGAVPVLNHATGPLRRQGTVLAEAGQQLGKNFTELVRRHEAEYDLAELHVVGSNLVREELKEMGIPKDMIHVIPYSADTNIFYPAAGRRERGVFRFLFAGQLTMRKGLDTLRTALGELPAKGWELVVCGPTDGRYGHDWLASVEKMAVRWRGPVSRTKLAEEMRRADLLVLPSLEEGFGLVVVQALACGCPCVVSDRVGAKDVIRHRENGSCFSVGNAASLATELRWWMDHRQEVRPIRLEWTWGDAAEALILLCRERNVERNGVEKV